MLTMDRLSHSKDAAAVLDRTIDLVSRGQPELAAHYMHVPLDYYRCEDVAMRERALFLTQPRALLAANEIPLPHSYLVRSAMGKSILLTRDEDGRAHAFLNYCRHRGAEPARGCGRAQKFVCPYHAWTYSSKGALTGMPLRDRNRSLDLAAYGLIELPSEERHGFVWVILTPGMAIDVARHLGEVDEQLRALDCARMTYSNSLPHERIAANWKCVAEGVVESLHVPFVHQATFNVAAEGAGERFSSATAIDLAAYDRFGPHLRYSLPKFGADAVGRLRAENSPRPSGTSDLFAQVWLLSPGILLAQELYGLYFADMEPGPTTNCAFFRYGWMSAERAPSESTPTPLDMARRAANAVREDAPVWEGCGRGLTQGGHGHALIGKNELGVQLFHESLADQTGYRGLRYSDV